MVVMEVFVDVTCPFTHVGLCAVARRRHDLGRDDAVVRVRAWPLELVDGVPLDPVHTAEHVDALRAQVAPALFAHFEPAHLPLTSLPALALAAAGYRQGDALGEAVSFALRRALFEEGADISRPDVLAAVADAHGLGAPGSEDDAAVLADWHEGEARGVRGSPHFFCGGEGTFCPSLEISRDGEGRLHVRRDSDALEAFLVECFARA
ncbi:MAG TPA: DsbA family protein [Acidimicrobiales bacterium]|nr:DsbA family protein [Acidimicrobiales bacterium]